MELLLDTNALIWWLGGRDMLSRQATEAISAPESDVLVSAASIWEMSIKQARGRLEAPEDLLRSIEAEAFHELPIRFEHAHFAGSLPLHHGDPFDRILIAQAQLEGLTIVTRDLAFKAYGVPLLMA
jgi:PIN domain nuclease of toxin-antitoxin system